MKGEMGKQSISIIILAVLLWIYIGCRDMGYFGITYEEAIQTKIHGQVESIVLDLNEKNKVILKVNNKGKRISFPVFSRWVDSTHDAKIGCNPLDTGYFCEQLPPSQFDSLFKNKGSEFIEIRETGAKIKRTVKIVSSMASKKVTDGMTKRGML